MFERYTERARRVLFFARYECGQMGHFPIEPVHLLLGLMREGKGVAGRILSGSGASLDRVHAEILRSAPPRHEFNTAIEVPFGADTKTVLNDAAMEADALSHHYIGTEHLLLALLRQRESEAAGLLANYGITYEKARAEILQVTGSAGGEHVPGAQLFIPPSYELRVSRSTHKATSSNRGPRHWILEGFTLRRAIAAIYGVPLTRIDALPDLDPRGPYDLYLILPAEKQDTRGIDAVMREALTRHFGLAIASETRTVETWVLSAPDGARRLVQESAEGGGGVGDVSFETTDPNAFSTDEADWADGISVQDVDWTTTRLEGSGENTRLDVSGSLSMDALSTMLESTFGVPVIDETHLTGTYTIDIHAAPGTFAAFPDVLHAATGLVLTPAPRAVSFLVVR